MKFKIIQIIEGKISFFKLQSRKWYGWKYVNNKIDNVIENLTFSSYEETEKYLIETFFNHHGYFIKDNNIYKFIFYVHYM